MTPEFEEQLKKEIEAARQEGYAEGYSVGSRAFMLKASDEMNDMLTAALQKNRQCLQRWANDLQRTLHAAGGVEITPYKNSAD